MTVELLPAGRHDIKKIKTLYNSAFPDDERAPFSMIKRRAKKGRALLLAAYSGDEFVGMVYLVCKNDLAYLFYFAVAADKRGMGYGSAILSELEKMYKGKRLFLAREQLDPDAENYDQRVKRHDFYLRNGFSDLGSKIKEATVVYDVMGIGGRILPREYDELMTLWAGRFMRKVIEMRLFE